ncbi:hypothetical protein [Parafrankia elaeagni]|uniref:hypothetical protein n=1 Tax=Parafrankia elaeagni TaxID=222534 RepID=UPI000362A8FF
MVPWRPRRARWVHLRPDGTAALHEVLEARLGDPPATLMRSIAWDQGTEMAHHVTISR